MMIRKIFGCKKSVKKQEDVYSQEYVQRDHRPVAMELEPKNVYFVYTPHMDANSEHYKARMKYEMRQIERRLAIVCAQNEQLVAAIHNLQRGSSVSTEPEDGRAGNNFQYEMVRDAKPVRRLALASTISTSTPVKDISVDATRDGCGDGTRLNASAEQSGTELSRSWRVARRLAAYCHKDNANAAALARIIESVAKGRMPSEIDLHLTNFEQLDSEAENYDDDECFERDDEKQSPMSLDSYLSDLKAICEDTLTKSESIHQNVIMCIGAGLLKKVSSPPVSLANVTLPQNTVGLNSCSAAHPSVSSLSSSTGVAPPTTCCCSEQ